MPTLCLPAPAKLNLFLHILGQYPDGYHQLQTIFQLLDYGDSLYFDLSSTTEIQVMSAAEIPQEDNLVWKAARLLQRHCNLSLGARIRLEKRLPLGGGLGGGSSDAATTLLALNYLWQTQLPVAELALLGRQLGADVPVFVAGHSAWAEGVGEILTPLTLVESWYVVLIAPCVIASAALFAHPQLVRNTPPITYAEFLSAPSHNEFEAVVRQHYPLVNNALAWLAQFAPARLTGSGSCSFARFANFAQAQQVCEQIPAPYKGFVAKGINRSPLYAALDKIDN